MRAQHTGRKLAALFVAAVGLGVLVYVVASHRQGEDSTTPPAEPAAETPSARESRRTAEPGLGSGMHVRQTRRQPSAEERRRLADRKRGEVRALLEDGATPGLPDSGVAIAPAAPASVVTKTLGRLVEDVEGPMDGCFEDILGKESGTVVVALEIIGDPDVGAVVDRATLESGAPPHKQKQMAECVEEAMFAIVFEDDVEFTGTIKMSAPFSYVGADDP